MDKKKLCTNNQKFKMTMMQLLGLVPDQIYLSVAYFLFLKQKLDLKNPKNFNEKINWYKIFYKNPVMSKLVDKYEVRNFVKEKVGSDILIDIIDVFDRFEDIDFDKLPDSFVMKATHASGTNIICSDKSSFDIEAARAQFKRWLGFDYSLLLREWAYKHVKPRILIEKYIKENNGSNLKDYKFLCFNGKARAVEVHLDRFGNHHKNLYDINWNRLSSQRVNGRETRADIEVEKPQCFMEMIEISEKLAKGFPFVRVDLYYTGNRIYFGELTFYPAGGLKVFESHDLNVWLGNFMDLIPYHEAEFNLLPYDSYLVKTINKQAIRHL